MKNKILSRVYAMYGRMYILTRICNTNWLTYYFLYICYIFHAEPSKHLAMYSRVPSLRSGWRLLGWPRPSCWACEASCYVFWLILHFVQDDGLFSGWRYVFNVSIMLSLRSILLCISGILYYVQDDSKCSGWRYVFNVSIMLSLRSILVCISETFERSFTTFRMTASVQDDHREILHFVQDDDFVSIHILQSFLHDEYVETCPMAGSSWEFCPIIWYHEQEWLDCSWYRSVVCEESYWWNRWHRDVVILWADPRWWYLVICWDPWWFFRLFTHKIVHERCDLYPHWCGHWW